MGINLRAAEREASLTRASLWRELRRAIAEMLGMFVLPTLLVVGVVELAAWRLGVTWTPKQTADALLASDKAIFLTDPTQHFLVKEEMVDRLRPEILVAGTSRVSQFRSAMFRPYGFYNIANSVVIWKQFTNTLERLPAGYHPRVMIFTLDYFMFFHQLVDDMPWVLFHVSPLEAHLSGIKLMVETALRRDPRVLFSPARDPLNGGPAIGLPAVLGGGGFRRDGSAQYGFLFREGYPYSEVSLSAPLLGQLPLYFAEDFDADQKQAFEEFVRKAHDLGIELVGVTVPVWAGVVANADREARMEAWRKFDSPAFALYLKSLNVHYENCLRLPSYYADRRYYIDSFHPTEPAILACMIKMFENPDIRALFPAIALEPLRAKLAQDAAQADHIDLYRFED